jgi:hypothetical protein
MDLEPYKQVKMRDFLVELLIKGHLDDALLSQLMWDKARREGLVVYVDLKHSLSKLGMQFIKQHKELVP